MSSSKKISGWWYGELLQIVDVRANPELETTSPHREFSDLLIIQCIFSFFNKTKIYCYYLKKYERHPFMKIRKKSLSILDIGML